jgi:hypothetical protein
VTLDTFKSSFELNFNFYDLKKMMLKKIVN